MRKSQYSIRDRLTLCREDIARVDHKLVVLLGEEGMSLLQGGGYIPPWSVRADPQIHPLYVRRLKALRKLRMVLDERNRQIEAHQGLLHSVISRLLATNPFLYRDDLLGAGNLALLNAVEGYQPSRLGHHGAPYAFSSYAYRILMQKMVEEIRSHRYPIHIPNSKALPEAMEVATRKVVRLDDPCEQKARRLILAKEYGPAVGDENSHVDLEVVKQYIGRLRPVLQRVIHLRYLEGGYRTLRDVAGRLGISPARVGQLEKQALQKLRELFNVPSEELCHG